MGFCPDLSLAAGFSLRAAGLREKTARTTAEKIDRGAVWSLNIIVEVALPIDEREALMA
jgi:hypothetical protein